MISVIQIQSAFRLKMLKLKLSKQGYAQLSLDKDSATQFLESLNSVDMFSGPAKNFLILDKSNIKVLEDLFDKLNQNSDLILILREVDKRSKFYKKLKSLESKDSEFVKVQNLNIYDLLEAYSKERFNIKLSNPGRADLKLYDEDVIAGELDKHLIQAGSELDISKVIEELEREYKSSAVFDDILSLVKDFYSEESGLKLKSCVEKYGADSAWNTLVWYGDMLSRIKNAGSELMSPDQIKVNSFTYSKLKSIGQDKISKLEQGIINAELKLKSGVFNPVQALEYCLGKLRT